MNDNPFDKHPQNPADETNASTKQTVEAKHNSSVIGVVQAHSINNSTINIHVDNRTDKDELPSKNNQNKKLHNLPERNRFFTGRIDVLNQLSDLIKSNQQVAIKQAISGMGGVGKTQTALEFCHQHINNYQTVLWINAENEISFNNSYYSLVDLLNLVSGSAATNDGTNQGLKVEQVISLVKRWLANNPNWLIVLDNLEDPKLIKDYLPTNHQGHVLITTRSQSLKGQAAIVQLKKMSPETGTLFLLKRANLIPIGTNNLEQLKADNNFDGKLDGKLTDLLIDDAQKIVQAMDGLPLALEQAGAYIQESECSLADYLKAYQDVRNTANILDNAGEDPNDHKSVYSTFKLNFDVVKEKSVAAAKLLEVCSFLDSDLIPEEIFTSTGKFLGDELAKLQDNTYEFNNCLKLLLNYSLIERDTNNKSLSIHRLVQTVIRELISEDNKKSLIDSLAKALWSLSSDDPNNPNTWSFYQKLLPSVTSLFDFAKLYQSNVIEVAYIFHQFGLYCQTQALYTQSLTFYNLATDIYKHHFGDFHPDVATTLNNIAIVYQAQGKYSDALDFYNQDLSITKHHFGDNHPDVATTLNNIAIVYQAQGKYSDALDFYNQSLAIKKHHFGDNHPSVALTLNNIAIVYQTQGKYSDALDFYNQSLAIKKHHFGDFHPSVALTLNNIGAVYRQQGKYSDALDFYNQDLTITKQHFGDNHPDVASTLNNIAIVFDSQGNYSDALDFYNQSLAIKKHHFGNFHPSVALSLWGIASVHRNNYKELEAIDYYQQTLGILDKFLPPNHPWIIQLLNQYSQLLLKLNKPDEAQPLLDRLASLESSS